VTFTDKNKLLHQSFRIEQDVIKALCNEAEKRDVSLSHLVNKILKNYVTAELLFEELGFIPVSKDFLRKTFSLIDEKNLDDLGRELGLTVAREYVTYFYAEVNGLTLLQFLNLWLKRYQSFQHKIVEKTSEGEKHYFTINHDINLNFSLALRAIIEGLVEPIIKRSVEVKNITENSLAFSFDVSL
jgi:hypothetical protein